MQLILNIKLIQLSKLKKFNYKNLIIKIIKCNFNNLIITTKKK